MTSDFLLEIGCEEIPSRYIPGALQQLKELISSLLGEYRLQAGPVNTWGTPRRLVVLIGSLESCQQDLTVKVKGPPYNRSYDEQGLPTAALQGFARSQKVSLEQVEVESIKGADYIMINKRIKGKAVQQILPELLLKALTGLTFPRTMYWHTREMRFARPVRWLLALYGPEVIPFSFGGVNSGRCTFGHRYLAAGPFTIDTPQAYFRCLEESYVILDQERRREMIRQQVQEAARSRGGNVVMDEELLEEICYLVEYPVAVGGSFNPEHLLLPPEVLVTSMKVHQRYFPVMDPAGEKLLPSFIGVSNHRFLRNTRSGYEKVLQARLSDARFFFDEDQKVPLEAHVNSLSSVVFQESLGSLDEKRGRLLHLAGYLCRGLGLSPSRRQIVERIAHLCKADLVTLMVREFPELQGVMGREYARLSGEPEAVARGIYEHYLPRYSGDELPRSLEGALVSLADRLDTLAGCFATGIQPTGSQDPYGLRRKALGMAAILVAHKIDLPWQTLLREALNEPASRAGLTGEQQEAVLDSLENFVKARINHLFREKGLSAEVIAAVTASPVAVVADLYGLASILEGALGSPLLQDLVAAHHRVANLAKSADGGKVNPSRFEEKAEHRLYQAWQQVKESLDKKLPARDFEACLRLLQGLKGPVDYFFDEVLVMAEERQLRENRLNLLAAVQGLFLRVANFSLLTGVVGRNNNS
ncbi:MAG: glycine--tRNA ligase subunit beta [Firmicutes bacterium]|nr:glycine--tRNA ligase subunit beta [Bacillota bacterium]